MANDFKKNVGGQISKKEALKMIEKYDKERKKDTKSVFFGKDVFDAIFSDPTVTGVSILFGVKIDSDGKTKDDVILVGTREDGTLVWNDNEASPSLESGSRTYDNGYTCPPYCPK